jgi:hypothetical protein
LSGSSPLTSLAWYTLPVAYATASIALGIMWPHKPHHYVKVGIPSGGWGWAPNTARKWQMGFNSTFKGLNSFLPIFWRFCGVSNTKYFVQYLSPSCSAGFSLSVFVTLDPATQKCKVLKSRFAVCAEELRISSTLGVSTVHAAVWGWTLSWTARHFAV